MHEIEVKILEVNVVDVTEKLLSWGAQKVFDGQLIAVAFDFPDKRLGKNDELLRLRKEGNTTKLTYKKLLSLEQAKTSEELEITVSDFETTEKILMVLGLQYKFGYPLTKHRVSYALDDTHFELDTFPEFPTYLEIEGPHSSAIYKYVTKLGFSQKDAKPWGVRELFKHYKKRIEE